MARIGEGLFRLAVEGDYINKAVSLGVRSREPLKSMSASTDFTGPIALAQPDSTVEPRGTEATLKGILQSGIVNAKNAYGDLYWKSAVTNVAQNYEKQLKNWKATRIDTIQIWTNKLENLRKNLNAAKAEEAAAKRLPKDDKSKKKLDSATTKVQNIKGKMDKWLRDYSLDPMAKAAEKYTSFTLGDKSAKEKIEELENAVHKIRDALKAEGSFEIEKEKAIKEAQALVKKAVKSAVDEGWKAKSIKDRKKYGLDDLNDQKK